MVIFDKPSVAMRSGIFKQMERRDFLCRFFLLPDGGSDRHG